MLQNYEFCSNFVTKFKNEEKKMKKILFGIMTLALMASCTESMEDRAVREAREYTEKVCPTPYINDSRTDSAVFDKDSRTYIYYLSLRNKADNAEAIALNRNKLHNLQKQALDKKREIAVDVEVLAPAPVTVDIAAELSAAAPYTFDEVCNSVREVLNDYFTGERLSPCAFSLPAHGAANLTLYFGNSIGQCGI